MESEIKASLIALLNGIKAADGKIIAVATAHLDGVVDRCRSGLHPQLVHFLERRSYDKALLFLGGKTDIPAGICGADEKTSPAR
jgi:hypothetical protein